MDSFKYLYHYTSIETLALKLKNQTIRFNPLDKIDDLQEQQTTDIKNIGQFCYISSWTDDSTESITMWNMYASLNLGVQIKLRKNSFKVYDSTVKILSKVVFIYFPTDIYFRVMLDVNFLLHKILNTPESLKRLLTCRMVMNL